MISRILILLLALFNMTHANSIELPFGAKEVKLSFTVDSMFDTLPTETYDQILISLAAKKTLQKDIIFDANESQYSEKAEAARNTLIEQYLWKISDGGKLAQ